MSKKANTIEIFLRLKPTKQPFNNFSKQLFQFDIYL